LRALRKRHPPTARAGRPGRPDRYTRATTQRGRSRRMP
jgi:hypothetical protein